MFVPTPRLLFLALCGVVAVALAGNAGAARVIAVLWLAGVVAVAVIDTLSVPPTDQLTWTRQSDSKLSLGVWNHVALTLQNSSTHRIVLQVRDTVPAWMEAQGEAAEGACAPEGRWEASYRVFPLQRGDYTLGPLSVRYLGPLGLAWRQRTIHLDNPVKVYPNLLAVQSYESAARRGQLEELGLRTSRRWGSGTEFERLRDYTSDDEFRRINWKATARRHEPIAVDYQTERSQNVVLMIDAGRLMATQLPLEQTRRPGQVDPVLLPGRLAGATAPGRPQALTRLDHAINAALLLAFVSQRYGDRVGLLAFSDRVKRYAAPRPGRSHFLVLTDALYNLDAEPTETDFAEAITYLAAHHRRRSLIVAMTDIAEPEAARTLVAQMGYLARRHLPLVVTMRDPGIERLSKLPIEDSETVYQRAVALALLDDRAQALLRLRQSGVLTLDVSADRLSPSLINRYLEIKSRSRL